MDLEVLNLDRTYLSEINKLEQQCHLSPWSVEQLIAEFEKDISLRLGLVFLSEIIAYSFSYQVADEFHILNLAVNPKFQSQGYGKRLLQEIIKYCRAGNEISLIMLEVRQSNIKAQNLYLNSGFREIAVRNNYYRNNSEAAIVMELRLF